jgi:hypothetical protein
VTLINFFSNARNGKQTGWKNLFNLKWYFLCGLHIKDCVASNLIFLFDRSKSLSKLRCLLWNLNFCLIFKRSSQELFYFLHASGDTWNWFNPFMKHLCEVDYLNEKIFAFPDWVWKKSFVEAINFNSRKKRDLKWITDKLVSKTKIFSSFRCLFSICG